MAGERELDKPLNSMKPERHSGEYVFCPVHELVFVGKKDADNALNILNQFSEK
jgi:hypothetical protein